MTCEAYFDNAKWVGGRDRDRTSFWILKGSFFVREGDAVSLNALGLGFFKCYINGVCINPDTFLPLSSDYEASCDPKGEILSGHRIYVPSFDLAPFVRVGENELILHFGGGWYTAKQRAFGLPKAIYRVTAAGGGEVRTYTSSESDLICRSFVTEYEFTTTEAHRYREIGAWETATAVEALDTEYCSTDCPRDALICETVPKKIGAGALGTVYDARKNTVGYPVLRIPEGEAGEVTVYFSEELSEDGSLDPTHMHKQRFSVVGDGNQRTVQPEFTWFGFRYFEVVGNAEPISVKTVHASVSVNSAFSCSNETLNWIYRTFLHTMLCNLHTGHPSDCPHIERRGYTGDGQLTCHAVLSVLDGRALYEKWLQDIADSQDTLTGHVQYTAPYIRSGGGPGGWGCAIVEVPYQLYRHYGDRTVLEKYYENMRRYIDYLEAHSEFGLVTSDKAGEWCLGDWCGPLVLYPDREISSHSQQMILPAPMVNTYFMVKSLDTMAKIARVIGREADISEYREKAATRRSAIRAAYFNTYDGNFVMNAQGANAYAVDLGLGDKTTYPNLLNYYRKLGHYDTGIFATDILSRVLFERGDADLAVDLLTSDGEQGYEHWRQNGATTFHEYWNSHRSRSHSHPMFGAPVAYFFEYLLGIRQTEDGAGYRALVIEPRAVSRFEHMAGSMETPSGSVSVAYKWQDGVVRFFVTIPAGVEAVFRYQNAEYALVEGENTLEFS